MGSVTVMHLQVLQQVSLALRELHSVLNATYTKQFSTNGALNYALRQNNICLADLIALGEYKAKQLKWVGPKVWNEAVYLNTYK